MIYRRKEKDDLVRRWCSGVVKSFYTKACFRKPTTQWENRIAANLLRDAIDEADAWKRKYTKLVAELEKQELAT